MNNHGHTARQVFRLWVLATWAGWALGVPLIAGLALIGEAVGIGGAQFLVGTGMGLGVGLMQGRLMKGILGRFAPWLWSCVAGLGAPFLISDLAKLAGWSFHYSLQVCVASGGIIVGVWQAFLLRSRLRPAPGWAVASAVGWALASGMVAAADSLFRSHSIRGLSGLLIYLGLIAAGGLALGLVTGGALARGLRNQLLK